MFRPLTCLLLAVLLAACSRHDAMWEEARDENTVSAYEAYLERYPEGPRAAQAAQRMRTLRMEQDWQTARERDNREGYEAFLASWPETELAASAGERLAAIARSEAAQEDTQPLPDDPAVDVLQAVEDEARQPATGPSDAAPGTSAATPDGSHRVQLAAVSTVERARDGVERLGREYASILDGVELQVEPAGEMFRLLTAPLPRERAARLCGELKAAGQDCLVRPAR